MEFLKNLSAAKLGALLFGALSVLVGITLVILNLSQPTLVPIYSALSPDDNGAIVARLQAMSVPYKLRVDNNQIEVPADKMLALRMTFAQEGLPSSGQMAGYELFDKADTFGTSQFVQNVNLVRALEGELSKTIATLSPISTARVHLVLPKKELFSKHISTTSASIVLKMHGAQQLNKSEIAAVTHIVASAVPDLKIENITIIDDKGNPLKLSTEGGGFMVGGAIDSATEYKVNLENRLTKVIEELLSRSVGFGKVKANVSANVDFDKEIINYEDYDTENQVIRSQRVSSENEKDFTQKKDVSLANNISNGPQQKDSNLTKDRGKSDTITNYEISKKVGNKITEQGKILNLSVAILVDGVYTPDAQGKLVYSARSEEEMSKLKVLAASAIGLDVERGDKIELINLRFAGEIDSITPEETLVDWIKKDIKSLLQTCIIGVIILLSVILIGRPLMQKFIGKTAEASELLEGDVGAESIINAETSPDEEALEQAEQSDSLDVNDTEVENLADDPAKPFEIISANGVKYASVARYLNDAVENHLEESLAVIKNWLYKQKLRFEVS